MSADKDPAGAATAYAALESPSATKHQMTTTTTATTATVADPASVDVGHFLGPPPPPPSGSHEASKKVLYGHDLVMIFPLRDGGHVKRPELFTADAFVGLLMGKDHERSARRGKIVVDPFSRVFRTPRCYLDDHGREALFVNDADHSERAEQERWGTEEQMLRAEYERFIGSDAPTTEQRFCELVATAVARRVQLACGLTTRMFRSCDDDEIIMTITADDQDLRVEADRTDYLLQVSNRPFDTTVHADKLAAVRAEIGDDEFAKSVAHLKRIRGCPGNDESTPEMDPLLLTEGDKYHPELRHALRVWGHTEEADGGFVEDESCRPAVATSCWGRFYHALMEISYDPRTYFSPFADYRIEPMYQPYYRRYPIHWGGKTEETLFTQKDRIRLAASIVHRHINTDALVVAEYLVGSMFALHNEAALEDLRHSWALRWFMLNQPLHKIRDYFGEKVSLYFAWLGFYTKMLIFPTIMGIITFAIVESRRRTVLDTTTGKKKNEDEGYVLIVFAVFVVIWSSVFAEVWKRKNHMFNALWGLHGYHQRLTYRAQFRGTKSYHPVTDEEEMTFEDKKKRRRAFIVSTMVVLIMIGIVIVALVGLFLLKHYINRDDKKKQKIIEEHKSEFTLGVTCLNAVQILLLNMVYREVAKKLNDYENHRTDREYENHLIIKVFLFQFCNSFASFFYIAFIKKSAEGKCIDNDCMRELRYQLLILFLVRIVVGNTLEVVVPYLKYQYQLFRERDAVDKETKHNYIEEQAKLVPYESNEAFEDYNEMVIQFGFINLFVVAFPLTPLLALLNNIAEVHVDSVKLCYVHRRPFPHAAKSIGAWFYILRVMSYIALATNAALILWTSDMFEETDADVRRFAFVLSIMVCFFMSFLIEKSVSNVPKQLRLLTQRNDHIVSMVFKNLFTGDDSQLGETAEDLDLTIYPNDQWDDRVTTTAGPGVTKILDA